MSKKIRVLIVDDSVVMRRILSDLLSSDPDIEVAGVAFDGEFALAKIGTLNPDIVSLDIEMPNMDGIEALKAIKKSFPNLSVIMCSSLTTNGGVFTLEALSLGADDYVTKPVDASPEEAMQALRESLIPRIKAIVGQKRKTAAHIKSEQTKKHEPVKKVVKKATSQQKIDILAIGTSTGGPNALMEVFANLPANIPVPIVIVQHMPPLFTKLLAERLTQKSKIPVKEAESGEELMPGKAWIAPGNFHMVVQKSGTKRIVKLTSDEPENFCRPSVDVLFRSVASVYGENVLAVIMTGMGQDGLVGCEKIRGVSGTILAQDEDTSVVWGMPGAVVNAGLADDIKPLKQIAKAIIDRVFSQQTANKPDEKIHD